METRSQASLNDPPQPLNLQEPHFKFTGVEGHFQEFLEVAPDAMVLVDKNGNIGQVNVLAEKLFGSTRVELVGQPIESLIPPRYRNQNADFPTDFFRKPGTWARGSNLILFGLRKDGTEFPLEFTLNYFEADKGIMVLATLRDVTARKKVEAVLKDIEMRFRIFVENIKDCAIVFLDPQGCVTAWNEGAERLKGYKSSEIIGRHFSVFYTPEDIAQNHPEELLKIAVEKGQVEAEGWRVRKDGSTFFADVVLTTIRDEKGVLQGFSKVTRDITEKKNVSEKMWTYTKELKESNASLRDFVSVASHDLQEPLRKIQTFGKFLVDDYRESLGKTGQGYVDRMRAAAKRMQDLIHALLDLTRVSTQQEDFLPVDLSRIVKEVLSDLEIPIQETQARLVIGALPTLEADATQMRQLFQNLIGNALKYHKPGIAPEVSVTSEMVAGDPGSIGGKFRITVKDNGIGFEAEYSDKIFAVFERLNVRDKYEGTGIGLAICKKVVERHGGSISAEGTPGEGSVFTVILPMKQKGVKTYGSN